MYKNLILFKDFGRYNKKEQYAPREIIIFRYIKRPSEKEPYFGFRFIQSKMGKYQKLRFPVLSQFYIFMFIK